jgi:hypothetical protein
VAGAADAVVAAVRDEDVAQHRAWEAPCTARPAPRSDHSKNWLRFPYVFIFSRGFRSAARLSVGTHTEREKSGASVFLLTAVAAVDVHPAAVRVRAWPRPLRLNLVLDRRADVT